MRGRTIAGVLLALIFCLEFFSCASAREANLHSPGDDGYIPVSENVLNIDAKAKQVFVYSVADREFLYIKGEETQVIPASTTKLMTALTALSILQPDQLVTPGEEVGFVKPGSSLAYIKEYHTLTVSMLIEGMLLPSGNDAAYALAGAAGRAILGDDNASGEEAVGAFVDRMNSYGKELGLCGSNFAVPDGYYDPGHYTTLEDMALIALAASENEVIAHYMSVVSDDVTYASGHTNTWVNTNVMLDENSEYYSEYVTGMKTGYTSEGGYCFLCLADDGENSYIIGIYKSSSSKSRFADAKAIVDKLLAH